MAFAARYNINTSRSEIRGGSIDFLSRILRGEEAKAVEQQIIKQVAEIQALANLHLGLIKDKDQRALLSISRQIKSHYAKKYISISVIITERGKNPLAKKIVDFIFNGIPSLYATQYQIIRAFEKTEKEYQHLKAF